MKKFWLAFLLAFIPLKAHAAITDPLVIQEKTVVIHFSTTVPAATTSNFDLIALSTTPGVFPHTDRGEIDISHINVVLDKAASSTGTVRIGVLNFVNSSTGSVSFFYTYSSTKNVSNTALPIPTNFTSAFYRCRVNSGRTSTNTDVDGLTPFILTNEKISGSSVYKSTTVASAQLPSPVGQISPAAGDIIMEVKNLDATNAINVVVDIWYHSEP